MSTDKCGGKPLKRLERVWSSTHGAKAAVLIGLVLAQACGVGRAQAEETNGPAMGLDALVADIAYLQQEIPGTRLFAAS